MALCDLEPGPPAMFCLYTIKLYIGLLHHRYPSLIKIKSDERREKWVSSRCDICVHAGCRIGQVHSPRPALCCAAHSFSHCGEGGMVSS